MSMFSGPPFPDAGIGVEQRAGFSYTVFTHHLTHMRDESASKQYYFTFTVFTHHLTHMRDESASKQYRTACDLDGSVAHAQGCG
mmetsp:Transcript_18837/g.38305  ORF Transcript_18837/g.38305 Transcript_18837/m.38305 type:complete len:84 (-) Transcript_18837:187-438(-)